MLVQAPVDFVDYGYIRIYSLSKILEIDDRGFFSERNNVMGVDYDVTTEFMRKTAYIVVEKNLDFHTLWGLVTAFPHFTQVIIISLSSKDRLYDERRLARLIMARTGRYVAVVSVYDPTWGEVLRKTPFKVLLTDDGTVRPGIGEAYILGTLITNWMSNSYIGYIDGNNLLPGTAYEYAMAFLSIFNTMKTFNHIMVRIKRSTRGWLAINHKPLRKVAKISQIVNDLVNAIISKHRGEYVDFVQTADTIDMGMTLEMAEKLPWARGRCPGLYHLIYILDRCWLEKKRWVRCPFGWLRAYITQIEAITPHALYEVSDKELLARLAECLGIIYHSRIADDEVKDEILRVLKKYGYQEDEPPKPVVYPPTIIVDPVKIMDEFEEKSEECYMPF